MYGIIQGSLREKLLTTNHPARFHLLVISLVSLQVSVFLFSFVKWFEISCSYLYLPIKFERFQMQLWKLNTNFTITLISSFKYILCHIAILVRLASLRFLIFILRRLGSYNICPRYVLLLKTSTRVRLLIHLVYLRSFQWYLRFHHTPLSI